MSKLKISFEKGGILYGTLCARETKAIGSIINMLPVETEVCHTRWCGREIYMPVCTHGAEIGEVTNSVSKFDLCYWRNEKNGVIEETISLFYGAESLRFHGGLLYVEIIGRIDFEQEELLEEIGKRIWLSGKEKVKIEEI